MSKNIVIFSDGTGQEGGKGADTNIYKQFKMIENRTKRQIIFYDRGLGTGFRKVIGSATGIGISHNIKECYAFIFKNYEAGDKIYLFGFSRGATTVRSLASFIDYFGILPKSRPELIDRAYKIYRIGNKKKRTDKAKAFVEAYHTMWTHIEFVGCYDTVAALGLPIQFLDNIIERIPFFKHRFHNLTLSPSVKHAYHALAIDDERKTFHPVLWDSTIEENQQLKQVWFCGMHTDVGGGYDVQDLSDIPLVWMIRQSLKHGLLLYEKHNVTLNPNENGKMHDSRGTFLTKLYRKEIRYWDKRREDQPIIHDSVLRRAEDKKNSYNPWILNEEYSIES